MTKAPIPTEIFNFISDMFSSTIYLQSVFAFCSYILIQVDPSQSCLWFFTYIIHWCPAGIVGPSIVMAVHCEAVLVTAMIVWFTRVPCSEYYRRVGSFPYPYAVSLKRKKADIWPSPITKAPIPTEMSTGQSVNTNNATKTSIKKRLRIDWGRSVVVTIATQLVWLNRFTGSQPSH